MGVINTYVRNKFAEESPLRKAEFVRQGLPTFDEIKDRLPVPAWENHQSAIDCYWKAWELAFTNLRKPTPENGFVSNYIDTAFNDHLFMWDSVFILMFGRYGTRAFNFQNTLDNLYTKQHPDGFICREISEATGEDRWQRYDLASTGPNVMAWSEWEYYLNFHDEERLARVFPALVAYYQWFRMYRCWPDGSYYNCGFGCGMDNNPRLDEPIFNSAPHLWHGFMSWADTTLQQIVAGKQIVLMARVLGRESDVNDIAEEIDSLTQYANEKLWDEKAGFYCDRKRDGTLTGIKSIGGYWALLAGIVPEARIELFINHLNNEKEFNRIHRVPSLAADEAKYHPEGSYWCGSIWAPTNYMVLRGLTATDHDTLAHEIAMNHHGNVVKVFEETGTIWENYAPDSVARGNNSKADFVGWSGLPPIAVLFEYVFGIRSDVPSNRIVWDVRLREEHGIKNYPFGTDATVDLLCKARSSAQQKPRISVETTVPLSVELRWEGGSGTLDVKPSA